MDLHHAHQRLTSTSVPDLRLNATSQHYLSAASKSLIRQQRQDLRVAHPGDTIARSILSTRRASLPQKPRRWTMPSKAASTRVLSESPTPMITTTILPSKEQRNSFPFNAGALGESHQRLPSSSQGENDSSIANASETPAMITLRRATRRGTSSVPRRTSLRPNAIVSFPPPKFNRTTSTYFSSFFGINPPRARHTTEDSIQTSVRQSSWSTGQDSFSSLPKPSVTGDRIHLTSNKAAAPAVTQFEVLPVSHSHADQQELLALSFPARRCSTTIVSGNSVHEIIWDENFTSSGEGSTDTEVSRRTSKTAKTPDGRGYGRRGSVLVDKLEAQLRNNDQRRASLSSGSSCENSTFNSGNVRRKSRLLKLTGWDLGSLNKADRPRQTSPPVGLEPKLNHDLSINADGIFATLQGDQLSPTTERVGFFPPLEGSAGNNQISCISRQQSNLADCKHLSMEEPCSTLVFDAPVLSERSSSNKNSDRKLSLHSTELRKPSSPDRQGAGVGKRSHVRRRSVGWHKQTFSTRSRKASKKQSNEQDEYDERAPLLATGQRSDDSAWPSVLVDAHNASGRCGHDTGPKRMSVQDFVHEIEKMSQGQLPASATKNDADPGGPGLVRRDSPWLARSSVSSSRAETDKRRRSGRGMMLSDVGEEIGTVRSILSREGSED